MPEDDILPPPLPSTAIALVEGLKGPRVRSLNETVREILPKMWDDPGFQRLFAAVRRSQTIEGSFIADKMLAAMKVREFASKNGIHIVQRANLHDIQHSLNVACRRFGISRKERLDLVRSLASSEAVSHTEDLDEAAE